MPRYLVQRNLGNVSEQALQAAAVKSKQVREANYPDIAWEHSHVVKANGGVTTYCIYAAASPERVKEHATAAGLPADAVFELIADVDPARL